MGKKKIYSLSYADDMMLLAEDERNMRSIIDRLMRYLDVKGLMLNTEKSKIQESSRKEDEKGELG